MVLVLSAEGAQPCGSLCSRVGVALEFQKVLDTHVELDTWKVGGGLLAFSQQRCFEVVLSSGELEV